MTRPIAIQTARQFADGDCSLAALAMLSGKPYATVRGVATALYPEAPTHGVTPRHLVRIAKALKYPLKARNVAKVATEDLDDATGLLVVSKRVGRIWHAHAVVLFDGVVICPSDGLVWSLDPYLAESHWSLDYLLESPT